MYKQYLLAGGVNVQGQVPGLDRVIPRDEGVCFSGTLT